MVERLIIAIAAIIVISGAAVVAERRRQSEPTPTGPRPNLPARLERRDFAGPDKPWAVIMFSSQECDSCVVMRDKVDALASGEVAIDVVEYQDRPKLHERYGIDSVPLTLVADSEGDIVSGFLGRVSATDLWAAVARARNPEILDDEHATQCGSGHVDGSTSTDGHR
ncbi:MAG: hypothetical protein H6512_05970 [Acidimicrobiia bacterium]|nr:hypothetical protein [Acidimicrobiia bacterium]